MATFTDWIHYNNLSYAEGKDRFDRNLAVNIVPQGAVWYLKIPALQGLWRKI